MAHYIKHCFQYILVYERLIILTSKLRSLFHLLQHMHDKKEKKGKQQQQHLHRYVVVITKSTFYHKKRTNKNKNNYT